MKLRVVKKPNGHFEPEYYDEEARFPSWNQCRLDNTLVAISYTSEQSAIDVCEKFAEKYMKERGEIVWTKEV